MPSLRSFADRCRSVLRAHDLLGRLGGEEFIALLPHTDIDGAMHVAEKLRAAVAATPVPSPRGDIAVTVSIGVAGLRPGQDGAELTARADHALYAAKEGGRNQVCLAASALVAV